MMHNHEWIHFHCMEGLTSVNFGHRHSFRGRTDNAYDDEDHVHYFSIYTSFNEGHSHLVYGYTSKPIYLPDGRHYHLFSGRTSEDGRNCHCHEYRGATSIGYPY